MLTKKTKILATAVGLLLLPFQQASTTGSTQYWIKVKANNKFERSVIANIGVAIEGTAEDYVIAYGTLAEKNKLEKLGLVIASSPVLDAKDFPNQDGEYHNYAEMTQELLALYNDNRDIVDMVSIGKTNEFRDIWAMRISTDLDHSSQKPAAIFMGGHHAREHLSVETPLRIMKKIVADYRAGNSRIKTLVESREIIFIPMVNPDGAEWDISTGKYKTWRKNRAQNANGTYGVDLNRNYGYKWGTGGSSNSPDSDVYMGPAPFSEPETQAIRDYLKSKSNINVLLSFHTFSELILYPWGYSYDPVADAKAKATYETMAQKMATWNGYKPQQSSDLYIASGDTTDWSYGELGIISFTFELSPANQWGSNGFYPGAAIIQDVVRVNTEPVLYLIEHADNPYRVIDKKITDY